MASKIKVDQIEGSTGSSITIPTGQTLTITDGLAASTIGSGTLADARLPTVPVTKGGTGLTSLGSAGQAVKVNSAGNALEFGSVAGGLLQSVTATTTSTTQTTSTGFVAASGLSASITPSSTSSKILILATVALNNNSSQQWAWATIYRGGSNLGNGNGMVGMYSQSGDIHGNGSIVYLDSPSTTSATTYQYYFRVSGGTGHVNQQPMKNSITLLEIGV